LYLNARLSENAVGLSSGFNFSVEHPERKYINRKKTSEVFFIIYTPDQKEILRSSFIKKSDLNGISRAFFN